MIQDPFGVERDGNGKAIGSPSDRDEWERKARKSYESALLSLIRKLLHPRTGGYDEHEAVTAIIEQVDALRARLVEVEGTAAFWKKQAEEEREQAAERIEAAEAALREAKLALQATRDYDEHRWNCRIGDLCKKCHRLKEAVVEQRTNVLDAAIYAALKSDK